METQTKSEPAADASGGGRDEQTSQQHSSSVRSGLSDKIQVGLALGVTSLVMAYLLWAPSGKAPSEARPAPSESVKPIGPRLIQIQTGHTLEKKLEIAEVVQSRISIPLLTVTGAVAASLRPEKGTDAKNWQFSAPEALTTYTDWQKAQNDTVFAQKQLATLRELVEAKIEYQKKYAADVTGLGDKGSISLHAIAKVKLDAIESQLDGQKTIHEAENALRLAKRTESSLGLQLEQAGLERDLLLSATPDMDIVMADVPLGSLSYVKMGQECKATFFGIRGHVFAGKVNKIVPVISKERRSLRVLFVIHDPDDLLRPGMFAEIDMGTNARDALLAPAEGLVHVGRADYFLVADKKPGEWRIAEVQIGEPYKGEIEVLDGLKAGERVLGRGAILLKPVVVRSLQMSGSPDAGAVR